MRVLWSNFEKAIENQPILGWDRDRHFGLWGFLCCTFPSATWARNGRHERRALGGAHVSRAARRRACAAGVSASMDRLSLRSERRWRSSLVAFKAGL